jgi:hypothetical protein
MYVEWRDIAGTLTASVTTLTVRKPDGTTATPPVTSPSTGRYEATITADQSGTWSYRFVTDDVLTAAEEAQFYVRRSAVLV